MKLLITILCLLFTTAIWAINSKTSKGIEYPSWERFIDDKEHSRLDASCEEIKDKPGNIICTFNEVMVLHKDTKNLEETLANIKNASNHEIKKELDAMKNFCKDDSEKKLKSSSKEQQSLRKNMIYDAMETFCPNPTREDLIKLLESELQIEKSTCTVFDKIYTEEFEYKYSLKKWKNTDNDIVSNLAEYNCGIINIDFLEQDPRKGWSFSWNYRTRKIVTNKSGSGIGGECSQLSKGKYNVENEIISYGLGSGRYEKNQLLGCKFIDFTEY